MSADEVRAAVAEPIPDFLSLAGSVPVPPDVAVLTWNEIKRRAYTERNRD